MVIFLLALGTIAVFLLQSGSQDVRSQAAVPPYNLFPTAQPTATPTLAKTCSYPSDPGSKDCIGKGVGSLICIGSLGYKCEDACLINSIFCSKSSPAITCRAMYLGPSYGSCKSNPEPIPSLQVCQPVDPAGTCAGLANGGTICSGSKEVRCVFCKKGELNCGFIAFPPTGNLVSCRIELTGKSCVPAKR